MKRFKRMLLLLLLFALLMAGYYAVSHMQESGSVTETEGTFELGAWTEESLAGLAWTNDSGSFDFDKQDGAWVSGTDGDFPVNQSALGNLADKMIALTGTREIADVENLSDYGLDAPAFSVTLTDADGKETVYAMGDETPFGDGYYLSVSGREAIYTISSSLSSTFSKTLTQLCELEEIPKLDTVTRLDVSGSLNAAYDEGTGLWSDVVTGETLDADGVEDLIDLAGNIEWSAVVEPSATEDQLMLYGLDEAQATLVHLEGGEDEALELLIGFADEDGNRYARLPGSAMVYTVEGAGPEELLGAGVETLWNSKPIALAYETLGSAEYIWETGSLLVTSETEGAQSLWESTAGLEGTERVEAAAQGSPVLTVAYTDQEGAAHSIELYAYSVDSYLTPITDTHAMLVPADDVDKLIRMLKAL